MFLVAVLLLSTVFTSAACPTGCECRPSEEDLSCFAVSCASKDLTTIPLVSSAASVQSLDLSNNQMRILLNDSFASFSRLSALNFAYNELEVISTKAFYGLRMLRELDLSYNNLQAVHPQLFADNLVLETVNLRSNPLVYAPSDSPFLYSPSITTLDLSKCSLVSLNPMTFSMLTGLYLLDISDNNLQSISMDTIGCLPNLKIVELANNRFDCSCELVEVMKWVNEKRLSIPVHKPLKCWERKLQRTLWTAASGGRRCKEPMEEKITELHNSFYASEMGSIPLPKTMEITRLLETTESTPLTESMDLMLMVPNGMLEAEALSNASNVIALVVLPVTLALTVLVSVLAVYVCIQRMRFIREIEEKDRSLTSYFSQQVLLEPGMMTRSTEKNTECDDSYDVNHVYEEVR